MEELSIKFVSSKGLSSKHVIYCKKHALRKNSTKTPNDRTLFSIGWPPYCAEGDIKDLFSRTSEVEDVFLRNTPGNVEETEADKVIVSSFRRRDFGYIVFKTVKGLDQVLRMCKSNMTVSCPIKNTGVSVLYREYKRQRPSVRVLRAKAEKQVEKYDTTIEEDKKQKRLLSEPDEEGWITVTKKNNVDVDSSTATTKRKRKKQKFHLKLYPFQMRETQRERLANLRKKFEEDKKRVAIMKARRKFKPF